MVLSIKEEGNDPQVELTVNLLNWTHEKNGQCYYILFQQKYAWTTIKYYVIKSVNVFEISSTITRSSQSG